MFTKKNTENHPHINKETTTTSHKVLTRPKAILAGAAVLSMLAVPMFIPGQAFANGGQVAAATPFAVRADGADIVPAQAWGTSSWRIDSSETLHIAPGTTGSTEFKSFFFTTYRAPWSNYMKNIRGVVFDDPANTHLNPVSQALFHKLYGDNEVKNNHQDTIVGINDVDTSQVSDMSDMFSESRINTLDLSNWNTSAVTNMSNMFSRTTFASLDISTWDTSQVANTSHMFSQAKFEFLDLSKWDMRNVKNMSFMFDKSNVTTLAATSWRFGNSVNASFMFSNSTIPNFDMSDWDVSQADNANFSFMFSNSSFTSLNVSSWDTLSASGMNLGYMFPKGLTQIVLGERSSFPDTAFANVSPSTSEYNGHWALGTSASGEEWRSLSSSFALSNAELAARSRSAKAGTYIAEPKGQETVQNVAIHFDNNAPDAIGSVEDILVPETGATGATFPAALSRPGYDFVEWNSLADGHGNHHKPGDRIPDSRTRTWYAQWKTKPVVASSVTVHFDKNAADATGSVADITVPSVGQIRAEFPKGNTLSRPGYKFENWNSRSDGTGQSYRDGNRIPNATVTTWYAQWKLVPVEPGNVAVHFDKNAADATGSVADVTVPVSGRIRTEFPKGKNLSRPGYKFENWNSRSDGTGQSYRDGNRIPNATVTTWYAQWKLVPVEPGNVAVHFDKNAADATGSVADVMVPSSGRIRAEFPKAKTLSRPGYKFDEWNSRADGTGDHYRDGKRIPNATVTTWYAQWKPQRSQQVCRPIVKHTNHAPWVTVTEKCYTVKL